MLNPTMYMHHTSTHTFNHDLNHFQSPRKQSIFLIHFTSLQNFTINDIYHLIPFTTYTFIIMFITLQTHLIALNSFLTHFYHSFTHTYSSMHQNTHIHIYTMSLSLVITQLISIHDIPHIHMSILHI